MLASVLVTFGLLGLHVLRVLFILGFVDLDLARAFFNDV